AAAAVRAGRVDDLKARIEARRSQPMAQLPASALLGILGLGRGDKSLVRDALTAMQKLVAADTTLVSAELACHAALPALSQDDLAPAAAPIVELAAQRAGAHTQHSEEPAGGLLPSL